MIHSKTEQTTTDRGNICQTVVSDVAATLGKQPEELQTSLYDVIDPEAVERVFGGAGDTHPSLSGHISFEYIGCRVTVYSTGEVEVLSPEETGREQITGASSPVRSGCQSHD